MKKFINFDIKNATVYGACDRDNATILRVANNSEALTNAFYESNIVFSIKNSAKTWCDNVFEEDSDWLPFTGDFYYYDLEVDDLNQPCEFYVTYKEGKFVGIEKV